MKFDRDTIIKTGQKLLSREGLAGMRWPDATTQRAYTGADGLVLLQRTVDFLERLIAAAPILESDSWKGLDYGVGFGRIASLVNLFGSPAQLTCADAWQKSLDLTRNTGLTNPMLLVGSRLNKNDLPINEFDMIYAYSIFTHFPEDVFMMNFTAIMQSLRPGGVFIFTLREKKFLDFLERHGKRKADDGPLLNDGFWFGNAQNNDYGDSVASEAWIANNVAGLGDLTRLGIAASEPFQCIYAIRKV